MFFPFTMHYGIQLMPSVGFHSNLKGIFSQNKIIYCHIKFAIRYMLPFANSCRHVTVRIASTKILSQQIWTKKGYQPHTTY